MPGNDGRGLVIQERDRHLLRELAVMRVIDREETKTVAGFGSTTRANARLLALTRAGLLRRFFLGTTGAGRKALYTLSAKGAQLVEVPLRGPQRRKDESLALDFFVEHQLAVNRLYCVLKYGALLEGVTFRRWLAFHKPLTQGIRLIPDGYVELQTRDGVLAAFLEVDLGHERRPVWKQKVRNYLQLALSGESERLFGQPRFRVLVLVPSERRLQSIRMVVRPVTEKLFWFASLESIRHNGFFASVWLRPKGDHPEPFINTTP